MLKIGLLICGHVRNDFQEILGGNYRDVFPAYLGRAGAADWAFSFYDVCQGQFPGNIHECDAYICSGSTASVYDPDPWIETLKAFVRSLWEAKKPFVGVCFGHQMLAEALGGRVQKSAQGWCVGVHEMRILETQSWMTPPQAQFNLLMMCQDQVQILPADAVHLATTNACPVAMFKVGKTMLGLQAHPEFNKPYNQALMHDRVARMGQKTVEIGLESLQKVTHETTVGQWIVAFVNTQTQPKN